MNNRKNILAINGSASLHSSNLSILKTIAEIVASEMDVQIIDDLTYLPHFRTELTDTDTPGTVAQLRTLIQQADAVIICSPEYVFSLPSGLKNVLEWCVSTTVFSNKPMGLITASSSGEKGHSELQLILSTLQGIFNEDTTLLIQGIKGKIDAEGKIKDATTLTALHHLVNALRQLIKEE